MPTSNVPFTYLSCLNIRDPCFHSSFCTCSLHPNHGRPLPVTPATSNSTACLIPAHLFILNTCPYHCSLDLLITVTMSSLTATSNSTAFLIPTPSFLLNTCPYHRSLDLLITVTMSSLTPPLTSTSYYSSYPSS